MHSRTYFLGKALLTSIVIISTWCLLVVPLLSLKPPSSHLNQPSLPTFLLTSSPLQASIPLPCAYPLPITYKPVHSCTPPLPIAPPIPFPCPPPPLPQAPYSPANTYYIFFPSPFPRPPLKVSATLQFSSPNTYPSLPIHPVPYTPVSHLSTFPPSPHFISFLHLVVHLLRSSSCSSSSFISTFSYASTSFSTAVLTEPFVR